MGRRVTTIVEPTEYKWVNDNVLLMAYPEHITAKQVIEFVEDSYEEVPKQLYINNFKHLGLELFDGENIWVCNFYKR